MRKQLLLFCIVWMYGGVLQAQNCEEDRTFDGKLMDVYVGLFALESDEGFKIADSLYKIGKTPHQKAGSLLLGANLLGKEGKHLDAIRYSEWALALAKESGDLGVEVLAYQNLTRFYAAHGFYDRAESAHEKGLDCINRTRDVKHYSFYKGLLLKAGGQLSMAKGEYSKAERDFKDALHHFKRMQEWTAISNTTIAHLYELLGRLYNQSDRPEEALEAYSDGRRYISYTNSLNTLNAGQIYCGTAKIYLGREEVDSAGYYINRAMRVANSNSLKNLRFKQNVYGCMIDYYRITHERDSLQYYHNLYTELEHHREIQNRENINNMMKYILQGSEKPNSLERSEESGLWWFFGGVLILGSSGIYLYRRRKNKMYLQGLEVQPSSFVSLTEPEDKNREDFKTEINRLSESVIRELERQLTEFEKEERYLDPEMSFPSMAAALCTNTKYLNSFLTDSLNTNYFTYINKKRIDYVVNRLQTSQKWHTYKLAYLSEQAGFSSYSAFANNFKRFMGDSPSGFIKSLKVSEEEK